MITNIGIIASSRRRSIPVIAKGGTGSPGNNYTGVITTPGDGYIYYTFYADGTFTVTERSGKAEILIVAGGGSGGSFYGSGGGGGGGLVYAVSYPLSPNDYPVVVGDGANGNINAIDGTGVNGEDSIFNDLTAAGGGGGGSPNAVNKNGRDGGSGGGEAYGQPGALGGVSTQIPNFLAAKGFGRAGGDLPNAYMDETQHPLAVNYSVPGTGGGGAGGIGGSPANDIGAGEGGVGKSYFSPDGLGRGYAGGGSGAIYYPAAQARAFDGGGRGATQLGLAEPGEPHTGGGAGGGGDGGGGANGGSGIVIVRMPYEFAIQGATRITTPGDGYIYFTFDSTGNLKVLRGQAIGEVLVVAGGGSGGGYSTAAGGGGGGGGICFANIYIFTPFGGNLADGNYVITIGAGGVPVNQGAYYSSTNGEDSVFDTAVIARGGGGGADQGTPNGRNGGSGGGASSASAITVGGTATQTNSGGATGFGNAGGNSNTNALLFTQPSAGGGGGGSAGTGPVSTFVAGSGGSGFSFWDPLTGSAFGYGGGGGGGVNAGLAQAANATDGGGYGGNGAHNPTNGTANRGGGGGAAVGGQRPGSGGSGIIIVRIKL